ncbi:MAG TPA: prolyl oligopeptidase family serine peptidase [Bryobacteraceae bacterium]|nr:prolyl oligopeptidase family serine peptidase [Bryobacteraceae bacterium]
MNRTIALLLFAAALAPAQAPRTRTDNVVDTLHGVEIVDPYRWLEDQKSPETRAWIDAQNRYTRSFLGAIDNRAALTKRLTELRRIDSVGTPIERGGRYFFSKRKADQDLSVLYVRKGLNGPDHALLDPHPMSPDHTVSTGLMDVSEDGRTILYWVRKGGADEVEVRRMDVDSRNDLPGILPAARYFGVSLTPDGKTVYYSRNGKEGSRVYRRSSAGGPEAKIFGDGYGPDKSVGVTVSEDGRYLLIHVFYGSSSPKSEIWFQNLRGGGPVRPIVSDIDARFSGEIASDTLYIQTNWNAPNNKLMAVDLRKPFNENWREIIPEGRSALRSFSLAGGRICANYLENVSSRVVIFTPEGKREREISFPSLGTVGDVNGRWGSKEAFFGFSSFHMPPVGYRYDVETGEREVWSRLAPPMKPESFELKQVWYTSKDGTKVPMFVLHRKGLTLDGSHPAYLTGYGGFNLSRTPGFSPEAVLWAEMGGIYAVPNLRGGGEFGEEWHKAGMLAKKQTVFEDFISAAEYLVEKGYTQPARLGISGRSNGGLLVAAALTQRPDLFGAVVCGYPLIDMVRYHKFLLGGLWVSEYGSADDPEQFRYIHAYSPYHRVKAGTKYPSVMFVTGDNDTRVDPLHARKMAALMQASTGSDRPMLLHYDTKSGHSAGLPLTKEIEHAVDELSYLLWQLQPPQSHAAAAK